MHDINLPFLESNLLNESKEQTDLEQRSPHYNLYESFIVNKLTSNLNNKSCCILCNQELEVKTPYDRRNIIEAECDGLLGCHFCELCDELVDQLYPGDYIIVKCEDSIEVAQVKLMGEIVKVKRYSMGLYNECLPQAIRKANVEDIEKVKKNFKDEGRAVPIFKTLTSKLNLTMKLVSIHCQFDRKKMFFFYTADGRVDFRELAKDLAAEFKTRIELRQIGVRDEAKKIGGMGTCGREYCCMQFLSSFKRITTQLANEQNLLSNMGKLSGPCGKLKCCLSFEIE